MSDINKIFLIIFSLNRYVNIILLYISPLRLRRASMEGSLPLNLI
jgi:hypothetical protein